MGKQHIRFEDAEDIVEENAEIPIKTTTKTSVPKFNQSTLESNTPTGDGAKWYHEFAAFTLPEEELTPLKEHDVEKLTNICQKAFESEQHKWRKNDPQDTRWLQTVLHKGTLKDRVNSGALLVLCNPKTNLKTLSTLMSSTQYLNSTFAEIVELLSNMWKQGLLPPDRKLKSIPARGNDWRQLEQNTELKKEQKQNILGQWYFEHQLKETYGDFLRGMQQSLKQGQEQCKCAVIACCADLLKSAPEKESMLLTMLVNKLGDPLPKIASKTLHALTDVAHRHPNMCFVIVQETEKLLFRKNVTERAVHFGLCLLANLTRITTDAQACNKMMRICFALFNCLVKDGKINNRTMLAILRCLKQAIAHVTPSATGEEVLSKDLLDTIYRLAHNAELHIAVKTFGLLLQLINSPLLDAKQQDRFYNALYHKLSDLQLVNVGAAVAAQLLHIVHRAMHLDAQRTRVQAYVKRLLQLALYVPPNLASAIIIVLHKLQQTRRDLFATLTTIQPGSSEQKEGEEDVKKPAYDPYARVPAFCGVEHTACHEMLYFKEHYHPTVQVLMESLLNKTKLTYFGDPLKDFSLTHFLDRFVFKNPKKDAKSDMNQTVKTYKPVGARGMPVTSLNASNCTEDEAFMLNFLERERQKRESKSKNAQDEDDVKDDVDDNEFDNYLDGFFGKKSKKSEENADDEEASGDEEEDEETFEFLKALEGSVGKKKQKHADNDDDDGEDEDVDEDEMDNGEAEEDENFSEDDLDSMEENEADDSDIPIDSDNDDDEEGDDDDDDEDDDEELALERKLNNKSKLGKRAAVRSAPSSSKKLKQMNSLFAAADDFSMMLEEAAEIKGQGTSNAVNTKGKKLSEKQLKWEQKRTLTKKHKQKKQRK